MKTSEFNFNLPKELIAQEPAEKRGTSRLMILKRENGEIVHSSIPELPKWIKPESLIVFNNTRVRKARIFGNTINNNFPQIMHTDGQTDIKNGGKVEFILLERKSLYTWRSITSKSKKQKIGKKYIFPGGVIGEITAIENKTEKIVHFNRPIDDKYLNIYGHMPLPPYIKRPDNKEDEKRYQTVYSKYYGSSAAPTAGLHFTWNIIDKLKKKGSEIAYIDLSVGLGTFTPIRSENIKDHHMHNERYNIPLETAKKVNSAIKENRDIIAVGTTVVRALESAWVKDKIIPGRNETDIFIYPGYRFNVVNKLFTNFHTPESSLIVLVSAFAGIDNIRLAYRTAIEKEYRFFSYGDAMFIL
ncbi:MAG: tRNA preQ1(34) S-adenosylmethionine ribosyltransferase-isomerase QueA [Spirochaetes bacterium]|nr:MAG: tRNA preQ1(34) S-adenosylmethionine ribosyltransferase-isomerase QueA [Spirochaetota bacterium]